MKKSNGTMTITLCDINEIPEDSAKGFSIDDAEIFAVKKDGEVFLYHNHCPHIGISLEFQPDQFLDLDRQFIQCANHGALFEIRTGACVAGPCAGKKLTSLDFKIIDNKISLEKQPTPLNDLSMP